MLLKANARVDKLLVVPTTDLRTQNGEMRASFELRLPRARLSQIGLHNTQLRMKLTQNREILRMLVDGDDLIPPVQLQARQQIFPNEPRGLCYNNLLLSIHFLYAVCSPTSPITGYLPR
jgi:hypothetical protein